MKVANSIKLLNICDLQNLFILFSCKEERNLISKYGTIVWGGGGLRHSHFLWFPKQLKDRVNYINSDVVFEKSLRFKLFDFITELVELLKCEFDRKR